MTPGGQFIGLREANRALRRLPEFAKAEAQQVMNVTAFHVARGAADRARVATGALKRGITWKARPRSLSAVVGVPPELFYWKFLEYGTVKMGEKPMFRPAAEANATDHERRMIRALIHAGERMARTQGQVLG